MQENIWGQYTGYSIRKKNELVFTAPILFMLSYQMTTSKQSSVPRHPENQKKRIKTNLIDWKNISCNDWRQEQGKSASSNRIESDSKPSVFVYVFLYEHRIDCYAKRAYQYQDIPNKIRPQQHINRQYAFRDDKDNANKSNDRSARIFWWFSPWWISAQS